MAGRRRAASRGLAQKKKKRRESCFPNVFQPDQSQDWAHHFLLVDRPHLADKRLTAVFPVLILILSTPYKHPIGWTGAPAGPIACRSHSVPSVDHCPKCGPFTVRKIPPERPSECRLPWSALLCRSHAHDRRVSTSGCPSFHATHAKVANEQAHLGKILPFFVVDCEPHGNALVYPHIRRRARPRYAMGQPADSRYARQVAGDGGRDRQSQRRPFDAHVPGGGGVPGGVEQSEGQRHR